MTTERDKAIRERAYELWIEGGRQHGGAEQHWLKAEREQATSEAPRRKPAATKAPASAKRTSAIEAAPKAKVAPKATAARKEPGSPTKTRAPKSPGSASTGLEPGR